MNTKLIGTGIMLAVLLATVGIGIAGADSASVVATYTSTYAPATCALSVAGSRTNPNSINRPKRWRNSICGEFWKLKLHK